MPIRFSEYGPSFPNALIDDMLEGKVVFLCGAGVSSPQLPGFRQLVDDVYDRLNVEKTAGEARSCDEGRYEEVLGALARRLSRPQVVGEAVNDLLQIADPDLARHRTLIRLSRDLLSRPSLVTTNFDTLFERAFEAEEGGRAAQPLSLAGQALPPPGGADFCGIIHLHGRLADAERGLEASALVMTSSEYGDAYMRSAWASRFLFDLVRCRTLVLVGYQAGDAPVRYFLNVLEADRERFEDLQDVYAFDGLEQSEADLDRWSTLAVLPLSFRKSASKDPFEVLWTDLAALADLVETPRRWRRDKAADILAKPHAEATAIELDLVAWLLTGKRDLWDVVIETVTDFRWFDHFTAQKIWEIADAAWVLASWCARDWDSRDRLGNAAAWLERFGETFAERLDQRLASRPPADDLMFRAWRLVATSAKPTQDPDHQSYRIVGRLKAGRGSDADIRSGVELMRPRIDISVRDATASRSAKPTVRLSDLFHLRLTVDDRGGVMELMDVLLEKADPIRLCEIATEQLRIAVATAREADFFFGLNDRLDDNLPTVERHGQNKYHDGVVFLVQLLSDALGRVAEADHAAARVISESWRPLPSRIGVRLFLHALGRPELYGSDEVAKAILALSKDEFWRIKRELILAMSERLGQADPGLVGAICRRILSEAPTLYEEEYDASSDQQDWRPLVRDRNAWLRLAALKRAGALPAEGAAELKAIGERHPFMSGDFEESDLFSSYSTGVRYVSGDPEPMKRTADPAKRLELAKTMLADWNPDSQQNWSAYCSSDPAGAFEALKGAPLSADNASLWSDLVGSLSWVPQEETASAKRVRQAVTRGIFAHLADAEPDLIDALARGLVYLLEPARRARLATADAWWDRLWETCERVENDEISDEAADRFYDHVINSAGGRLAEQLITEIDARKTKSRRISPANRARLRRVMASDTPAGWLGRGACVSQIGFLFFVDPLGVRRTLKPWIAAEDRQGETLRAVLVEWARLGDKVEKTLVAEILQGVRESQAAGAMATHVANRLVRPLFLDAVGRGSSPITRDVVRKLLKAAAPSVLEAVLQVMEQWVLRSGRKPENAWRQAIGPVFEAIWPKERTFRNPVYTRQLAELCVATGPAFPEALNTVRPFLLPFEGGWRGLHFFTSSTVIESHPRSALELLWILCGPGSETEAWELDKALAKIGAANPHMIRDRRFQWLEQRAPYHG
ncbi:SIR2 family protein [uncultured Brevundimonas sp.]|uniref:SIR2 family protein n=1 Tax=uncultured Brevundimonas sp. TaxID=213418 RepID=UPI0025FEBEC8|nr:SIR2 family protein [uncultured Brevundimonas sp.]